MRVKSVIKKLMLISLDTFGVNWLLRKRSKTPIVLFWHGVAEHANLDIEGESFPKILFEDQIRYIAKHYNVISIDEYYRRYCEKSFTNREVVITFDDGYKDNLTVAAPILKKYNLPFTIFVSGQNIEEQRRFYISTPRLVIIGGKLNEVVIPSMNYHKKMNSDEDRKACAHEIEYTIKYFSHKAANQVAEELVELIGRDSYKELCQRYTNGQLLSWDDIIKLTNEYDCTIGSHCLDHCICHAHQDKAVVEEQISKSKQLIESRIGCSCDYFAYPNGDFSDYSNSIVSACYKMGFSTLECPVFDKSTNVSCIGRIGVPCDMLEFKFLLSRISLR